MMRKRIVVIGMALVMVVLVGFVLAKSKKGGDRASNASAQELYNEAQEFAKNNEVAKARELYQQIMTDYPDYSGMEDVQKELETVNMQAVFSNIQTPNTVAYQVQSGDSLGKLAQKFGTTIELIKKRNNLTKDTIRAGQTLSIYSGKFNIYVDKSQNILILKDGDEVVKIYHVSTGTNNSTPVGDFKITTKLVDPVWFKSGAVIPPESPENVLGSRWMGFDIAGYGIHGTVEPENIGKQVTAGCVRMRNEEVEELYAIVPMGTQVVVVD